ncbi:hypothetical protein DL96DRAFT_1617433 [Flagelloscypha sp. PMI_526]|nr:hypothetical protein DL96DRAFT_1617433 [Flagelloscypha sp. PMI_526]
MSFLSTSILSHFRRPIFHALRPQRLNFSPRSLLHNSYALQRPAEEANNSEALNVSHSRFLAEASGAAPWKERDNHLAADDSDYKDVGPGKGRLNPTASHIFKLILPLDSAIPNDILKVTNDPSPLVMLLHPSQPLSHISRLILSEIVVSSEDDLFVRPDITFRTRTSTGDIRWSDSTDVGDFIRASAKTEHFDILVKYRRDKDQVDEKVIDVDVGTFAERTRFLRSRLAAIDVQVRRMAGVKKKCDSEAHAGARRMAIGGFGMLVVYWGLVCELTFFTSLGWDVMEPVTYLSGLSMVILGYLWFLYQGREVSYSSVLKRSISARREALYVKHGFNAERWDDLMTEAKTIKKDISRIAEDYDFVDEDADEEGEGEKALEKVSKVDKVTPEDDKTKKK